MILFLFLFISLALIVGVEVLKRRFLISTPITRRCTHIGAALIAALSPLFLGREIIIISCLFFAFLLFLSRRSNFFSSIHNVNRSTLGEVFLPLGEAFSALFFLPGGIKEFQFGVLVMGLSDAAAGIIGDKFGKHKVTIFGNKKSIEGSISFFLITLLLTFIFVPTIGFHLILIPLVLMFVELVLGYGLDNLALPIIGAILLTFIML